MVGVSPVEDKGSSADIIQEEYLSLHEGQGPSLLHKLSDNRESISSR